MTGSQDQGQARPAPRRRPAQSLTGSPACGLAALNPWAARNSAVFAQVKAKRRNLAVVMVSILTPGRPAIAEERGRARLRGGFACRNAGRGQAIWISMPA